MFIKDEIGRLNSINKYIKLSFINEFKIIVIFLSLIDRFKFLKYLNKLSQRNDKKILDKLIEKKL